MSVSDFYYLNEGEIICYGDQVEVSARAKDDPKWEAVPQHMVGKPAGDPKCEAHSTYRRRLQ